MNHREALVEVMQRFSLKASDLAIKAELEPSQLSRFKTGRNSVTLLTWEKIVNALPQKARAYLYFLLATNNDESTPAA